MTLPFLSPEAPFAILLMLVGAALIFAHCRPGAAR
jgi:hypothetical protein